MRFLAFIGWTLFGLVVLAVVLAMKDEGAGQFEVRRVNLLLNDDGRGLEITNIGKGPVTLKSVQVNERAECSAEPTTGAGSRDAGFPVTLNAGEKITVAGACRAVGTVVVTDKGSAKFSF
jgi:hypothetical protein